MRHIIRELPLCIQNFNFDIGIRTVHDGKGKKDRAVPLPETIIPDLKTHLESVIELHRILTTHCDHGIMTMSFIPFLPSGREIK